jgi:DNA mismatch endonuclease (patch repair protein)
MDHLSSTDRSRNMAAIRSTNTKPELAVRRFLHARGLRYRLHVKAVPGKPDLVFRPRRAVVFVHGCFWHGCPHCSSGSRVVKSNADYWLPKLERNQTRDAANKAALESAGWTVFTVWECQTKNNGELAQLTDALQALPTAN